MAHPFNELRSHKVQRKRVSSITGGLASAAVPGLPMAPKAAGIAAPEMPMRADGGAVSARADRVARKAGGRVGNGKTNINIIVAPKSGDAPATAGAPPPLPPKPPMAPPPPVPAMGAPPGLGGMPPMPPGMPPGGHSEGGRAYKKGGAVRAKSDASVKGPLGTGIGDRTPIQHSGNKSDTQNIGRKPVITKAAGGAIYADGRKGKQMAWNKGPSGGGGGLQRIAAAKRRKPAGHEPWAAK
jgi:hypothetical protein